MSSETPNKSNLRILIIDDNPQIHQDFIKILTKARSSEVELSSLEKEIFGTTKYEENLLPEFFIQTASQGKEGVEYVEKSIKDGLPYALAFVDIRMPPGWDGIETIQHIWELDPDVQIVICTAYSDYSWEETVKQLGQKENLLILKKPFDSIAIRQLACALTKKWQLLRDTKQHTSLLKEKMENRNTLLEESLSLVKATFESSNNGILVANKDGDIIDYNLQFVKMWKIPHEIIEKRNGTILYQFMKNQLTNPDIFLTNINEIFADSDLVRIDIINFIDGRIFEYYTQPQKVGHQTVGRVFDFRDITKRVKLEEKLNYQTTHDSLTGLPNRSMLLEKIEQLIKVSERNNLTFAIILFNFDKFQLINNSLIHEIHDKILIEISNRLKSLTRTEDILAHISSDEFIILFNNIKDESFLLKKIKTLQEEFNKHFIVDQHKLLVTTDIGISVYPRDGMTADELLRNADVAMYESKLHRGNS